MPLEGATRTAGLHTVPFEATGLPAGLYFARLGFSGRVTTEKLVLLR